MKKILTLCLVFYTVSLYAQSHKGEIVSFQQELNVQFIDPETSPLHLEDLETFGGLDFFTIDENYRIEADFERVEDAIPFEMKTTTSRKPIYEIYGIASFVIDGISFQLNIYQSHSARKLKEYKNNLFLPFTDLTNGKTSYKGGRYISLEIPEGNQIIIDFNKAYNPYCAYSSRYSCPIVPEENHLDMEITAGVKHSSSFEKE